MKPQVGILHIQLVLSHLATETFTAEEAARDLHVMWEAVFRA